MKKIMVLIFIIGVIPCNNLFSQKKYEKLFKKSIQTGRSYDKFYKVNIKGNKVVPKEKIIQYKDKYVIRNIRSQKVNRFGDNFEGVKSFEFIPKNEINSFLYANVLKPKLGFNPGEFESIISKPKGELYFFTPGKTNFQRLQGLHWTGKVSNNTIQGQGVGLYIDKNKNFIVATNGNYQDGILQGTGTFFIYQYGNGESFDKGTLKSETITLSGFNDDAAMLTLNGKKGFVDKEMNTIIQPNYSTVLEVFNNGKAVVLNDKKEEIIIDKRGEFVAFTEKQEQIFEQRRIAEAERKRIAEENEKRRIRDHYNSIKDSDDEVKLFTFFNNYKNSKYEFARDFADTAYTLGTFLSVMNLDSYNREIDYDGGSTLVKILFESKDGSPIAPELDKIYDFIDSEYSSYGMNTWLFGKVTTGRKDKLFVGIRNPVSYMNKAIVNAFWYREGTDREGGWSFTQNSGFQAFTDNVKEFASQNGMKVKVGYYGSMDADIARVEARVVAHESYMTEQCDRCVIKNIKNPSGSNDGVITMRSGDNYYYDYRDGKYRVSKGWFSSRDTYPDAGSMTRALEQRCREYYCR